MGGMNDAEIPCTELEICHADPDMKVKCRCVRTNKKAESKEDKKYRPLNPEEATRFLGREVLDPDANDNMVRTVRHIGKDGFGILKCITNINALDVWYYAYFDVQNWTDAETGERLAVELK